MMPSRIAHTEGVQGAHVGEGDGAHAVVAEQDARIPETGTMHTTKMVICGVSLMPLEGSKMHTSKTETVQRTEPST